MYLLLNKIKVQYDTIEVEVATQNVTDYDALIIDAFDETKGLERGLRIYSQSAELKSQNNTISAQFREAERIRLTFTIEPSTLNKLIMIYILNNQILNLY